MKILCANEGFVSNFELLELLRQRTQEPGHAPTYPQPHDPFPTELQCYESLRKTAAGQQTKANLEEFLRAVKVFYFHDEVSSHLVLLVLTVC